MLSRSPTRFSLYSRYCRWKKYSEFDSPNWVSNRYGSSKVAEYRWNWVPGWALSWNFCPAPRNARPIRKSSHDVGNRVMSKFDSFSTMLPLSPAFELIPPPTMNCPVFVSFTRTSTSWNSLSISFGRAITSGGLAWSKMPSRASRILASSSFGYWRICPG